MLDALIAAHPALRALWVVWFLVLFVAILAVTLRPSRRRDLQQAADIPLRDDR